MEGPLFALDGHDLTVFRTVKDAEGHLEAIDVRNGVYRFFRRDGTEIELGTDGTRVLIRDREIRKSPEDLANAIRRSLRAIPATRRSVSDAAIDSAPLADLVAISVEEMAQRRGR